MVTKRWIAVTIGVAALVGLAACAAAQTETTSTPASQAAAGPKWHFTIPFGVWPFGISGPTGAAGYETDVDMSISDVQELKDRCLRFAFEAGRGKWTALAQAFYLRFQTDPIRGKGPNGVDALANPRLKWWTAELAGAYQAAVVDPGPRMLVFEPLVGVRYTKLESSLHVEEPIDTTVAKKDVEWVDAFVGFRALKSFTKNIGVTFRGDIGAGGSDMTWNAAAALGYRFPFDGSALTVAVGYKAEGIDYQSEGDYGFFFDQTMTGPTLGVAYSF